MAHSPGTEREHCAVLKFHHRHNDLTDPIRLGFDLPVSEMGVVEGHADVGMTEHAGDYRYRHAIHHRMAGMRVPEVMKLHILDAGLLADPVPNGERTAARPGRIERRRKHEVTFRPRLAVEDAPDLGVERNPSRSRLGFGQNQPVRLDLRPAKTEDLPPSAVGEQKQPDDVRLLVAALFGPPVQCPVQPGDFLA